MITRYPVPPPDTRIDTDLVDELVQVALDRICCHRWELRWQTTAPVAHRYRLQCTRCGAPGPVRPRNRTPDGEFRPVPEYDSALARQYLERKTEKRDQLLAKARARADAEWRTWYEGYLRSPQWRERRKLVLKRAHGTCEACGKKRATEVHHLTYRHVGCEPLYELAAVDDECHDQIKEMAG